MSQNWIENNVYMDKESKELCRILWFLIHVSIIYLLLSYSIVKGIN